MGEIVNEFNFTNDIDYNVIIESLEQTEVSKGVSRRGISNSQTYCNVFVIYDDITIGLLWKSPAKQYIGIFSGITSSVSILSTICNIIAYLCQPKQESYLQHH